MRLGCSAVVNIRRRPAPHSHGAWHIGAWRTIDRRPRTTLGEPSSCKVRHRMYAWDRPCGVQGPRAQHGQDHVRGWAGGAAAGPPANLLAEFTPRRAGLLTYNKPATGFRLALGNWGYHAPRGACGDAAGKARAVGAAAATAAAATAAAQRESAAASTAVAQQRLLLHSDFLLLASLPAARSVSASSRFHSSMCAEIFKVGRSSRTPGRSDAALYY